MYQTTVTITRFSCNGLSQAVGNKQSLSKLNLKHLLCFGACQLDLIIHLANDPSIIKWFNVPTIEVALPVLISSFLALMISIYTPVQNRYEISSTNSFPKSNYLLKPMPVFTFYFVIRILYLITYEIFFRLSFLESISHITSSTPAIFISTFLYGFLHRYSRKIEYYSSFFFGLILCWLVIHTESILPAIIIHLLLSLPYECKIIYYKKLST